MFDTFESRPPHFPFIVSMHDANVIYTIHLYSFILENWLGTSHC